MADRSPQEKLGSCPICGRDMINGNTVNEHHLVPKSREGRETITLHVICHTKIHSLFTEKELATTYNKVERLVEHEEMAKFVKWLKRKDPEFIDRNRRNKRKPDRGRRNRRS